MTKTSKSTIKRCSWVGNDELYQSYHDSEWGVPEHDDHKLFECLTLEGAQAGLSWITVLKKREHYRKVFKQFDPARVARFKPATIEKLMNDPGIIRNRLKVESTVSNARAVLELQNSHGSLDEFLWQYVDGKPLNSKRKKLADTPSETDLSKQISRDLKKLNFRFIGPTTVYAFMQAVGMVNDHSTDCFRYKELEAKSSKKKRK